MERNPTDRRIDDLSDRVGRFEGRFERFEDKVDARFDKVVTNEAFREALKIQTERFDAIDKRLDKWGRALNGAVGTIIVAVILKFLGVYS